MRTLRLLLLAATTLVVAACGDDDDSVATNGSPVDGAAGDGAAGDGDDDLDSIEGEYLATEVNENGAPKELVADTTIRLTLMDGMLGANAGCNTMGGDYTISDGTLRVEALVMTEMGCDPALTAQDDWLVAFLSAAPSLEPIEEGFVLRTDTAAVTFVDHSIVEPDLDLVGPTWEVTGYIEGSGPDGAVSSVVGTPGTVVFESNGFVAGHDGCNEFGYAGEPGQDPTTGLRFMVDGDQLTFTGSAVSTDMACPDVDTDRFWAVLSGTITWEIDAANLTLLASDGTGVTYRAQDQ